MSFALALWPLGLALMALGCDSYDTRQRNRSVFISLARLAFVAVGAICWRFA
jgi:hypothetical protein